LYKAVHRRCWGASGWQFHSAELGKLLQPLHLHKLILAGLPPARAQDLANLDYTLKLGSNVHSCMFPQLVARAGCEEIVLSNIFSSFAFPKSALLSGKRRGQRVFSTIFF
jgi:hypothetical protein